MRAKVRKIGPAAVALLLLLAGCTGSPTIDSSQTSTNKRPVQAAHIRGDLTYQDVLQKGEHIHVVTMSPDGSRIWLGTHSGLYASASEGLWTVASPDVDQDDVTGIVFDPARPHHIEIVGDGVSKRSTDGGRTWQPVGKGMPAQANIIGLAGLPVENGLHLAAIVDGDGLYRSVDGGDTWDKWMPLEQELDAIAFGPDGRLYGISREGLATSDGKSWTPEAIPGASLIYAITADHRQGVVYASTDAGVYRKQDGIWELMEAKPPEQLLMIGTGSGAHQLIGVGESATLYTLVDGTWNTW